MRLRNLLGFIFFLNIATAFAQSPVYQSGSVTPGHAPVIVTNGVIGDGGTSADSPITSLGATGTICSNSARQASGAWQQLCLTATTASGGVISLQNFGTAPAGTLSLNVNGVSYPLPGALSTITIGTTPVTGGTNGLCLYVSAGFVGQQTCTLSAITSLTGDGTAIGPGAAALTLATVNNSPGTFGSGALVPIVTVNGKGLVTAVTTAPFALTIGVTTLASGANNALLYQSGGLLSQVGVVNSAVLTTNSSGGPSLNTTLPAGLTIPGVTISAALTYGGVTLSNSVTGTGAMVLASTPTLITPVLGAATATSVAIGGCSLSSNAFCVTGNTSLATLSATATAITSASANAFAVGLNGATTPAFNVNASTASQAAGLNVTGAATGGTVAIAAIDSGNNTSLTINAKGSGTIGIGSISTGTVTVTPAAVFGAGVTAASLATPSANIAGTVCMTSGGVFLYYASNNCFSASATSITVGSTTITGGTNPYCLNDNSGTLGNVNCARLDLTDQALSGGATVAPYNPSPGSLTIDCGKSPLQWIVNTGAFTITAPITDSSCVMEVIGGSGAGAITLTNFSNKSPIGQTYSATATSTATVTFTNSSANIGWTTNGLNLNSPVYFTTSGSLPTNFTSGTIYYVSSTGTNTIQVSASPGGSAITAGSAGSGTQTGTQPSVFDLSITRVNGVSLALWVQPQ